jgi:hypothetical protein
LSAKDNPLEKVPGYEISVALTDEERMPFLQAMGPRAVHSRPRKPFPGTVERWRATVWTSEIEDARSILAQVEQLGGRVNYSGMERLVRDKLLEGE